MNAAARVVSDTGKFNRGLKEFYTTMDSDQLCSEISKIKDNLTKCSITVMKYHHHAFNNKPY